MFPPFDEEEAYLALKKITEELSENSAASPCPRISLVQVSRKSEERDGHGIMLGAMTAFDKTGKKVLLLAPSGISFEFRLNNLTEDESEYRKFAERLNPSFGNIIFVPPVVPAEKINEALSQNDEEIHILTEKINSLKEKQKSENSGIQTSLSEKIKKLTEKRTSLCSNSLQKVYSLYEFSCFDGKTRSLSEILKKQNHNSLPPTGTGDCTAPKLLHYAFKNGFTPLSMCEIFYGKTSPDKKRINAQKYGPCDNRCALILPGILGLNIIYRDEHILVVNKQSGLLSVPGRGVEKQDCIVTRAKKLFPQMIEQPAVHRLDMETSGIMILAFTKEAHRALNRQFEEGKVEKKYTALLDGNLLKKGFHKTGTFTLYFRVDIENRPHQIWDSENGKKAVTEWKIEGVERYKTPEGKTKDATRVTFIPHTGRTHQLRLASADIRGFNTPIIGDTLYGNALNGERLMLHAAEIRFTHPVTNGQMEFKVKSEF